MLKIDQVSNIYVASFENDNRFNALNTEPVKGELNKIFDTPESKLILNLEGINFIDSSGFGVFLSVMKTATINHGQFKICNIKKEVMDLFKLLQLHNVFDIYNNLDDCMKSFN
jgi:anti-sigma B factor antagonist